MVSIHSHIGARLRNARKYLGFSQTDLAARFGVARGTWDNYENGRTKPTSDVLEGLVELGLSPAWLLTGHGQMASANDDAVRAAAFNVAHFFGENLPSLGGDGKKFAEEFISVVDYLLSKQEDDPSTVVSLVLERVRAADRSS